LKESIAIKEEEFNVKGILKGLAPLAGWGAGEGQSPYPPNHCHLPKLWH